MLRILISVFAAALMCVLAFIMLATVPFAFQILLQSIDVHGLLHGNNIVPAVCAIIGGRLGYITLRYGAALFQIRMRILQQRCDIRPAVAVFFFAFFVSPIVGDADGDGGG